MEEQLQKELPLRFPESTGDLPLLPARMVNEYQYCPRLAYLEWVQGEWAESADTVEGKHVHRRVDKSERQLPNSGEVEDGARFHARSITLSSERLGTIAKVDLVEGDGDTVTPVDYKRGKRPHVAKGAYDPERVQLCIQALLLEEHGFQCPEGILYFAASKERVRVVFDEELRSTTQNAVDGLRLTAAGGTIPPPLEDSPKCPRCSLVGICLPDEVNYLSDGESQPRPMAVRHDEALPVYVQANHAKVSKKGEVLEIKIDDEKVSTARLVEVSQLVLMGNIYLTTPALHELLRREIPITWHSYGGWYLGHSIGVGHKNVELRTAQYRASFDDRICLEVARNLVKAKILNCRTLLRRNWRTDESPDEIIDLLKRDATAAMRAKNLSELLGIEGAAASRYFGVFSHMIKKDDQDLAFNFDFAHRNRRPPTDAVNALLSYAYSLLTRTWSVTLSATGFDPYRGFYHQPRYGRPALALDMMEPFRPLLADSCVLTAINNGEVKTNDFVKGAGAINLKADGRKRFIGVFERRLTQEITHPLFSYKVSYRRLLEVQSRLLGRYLLGELDSYPNFTTR